MVEGQDNGEFADFVRSSSRELQRSAWLLCGDWHSAQDLVQTALAATWPRWVDIQRDDRPQVYVYRVMVNAHLRARRRRWRGELPTAELPEPPAAPPAHPTEMRDELRRALSRLSPQQRTVVVLRYFVDLSEADVATAVGCSIGAVKSHASRAVRTLREAPELIDYFEQGVKI